MHAPSSLGLGLWGEWVFDIGEATPGKDGADGRPGTEAIDPLLHSPSKVFCSCLGFTATPVPVHGVSGAGSPARCVCSAAPRIHLNCRC
jgi:hypothetical protein